MPFLVRPVRRDGRVLVDGGVLHKVPVRLAREMGAEIVIAVDLSRSLAGDWQGRSPVAALMQVLEVMDRALVRSELAEADIVIAPGCGEKAHDFRACASLVGRGEQEMKRALPQLRQRLEGEGVDRAAH